MAEWWVTCTGITQGPVTDGSGAGPYQTEAKARAAFQAGTRPPGCPDSGSGSWWLEETADIARGGAVWHEVQSASRPRTGGNTGLAAVKGPYKTRADADKALSGLQNPKKIFNDLGIPTGLAAIGNFFNKLGQAHTWIRVGEVLLGLILIAVGVAKITNAVPIATDIAKTAAKVAVV